MFDHRGLFHGDVGSSGIKTVSVASVFSITEPCRFVFQLAVELMLEIRELSLMHTDIATEGVRVRALNSKSAGIHQYLLIVLLRESLFSMSHT